MENTTATATASASATASALARILNILEEAKANYDFARDYLERARNRDIADGAMDGRQTDGAMALTGVGYWLGMVQAALTVAHHAGMGDDVALRFVVADLHKVAYKLDDVLCELLNAVVAGTPGGMDRYLRTAARDFDSVRSDLLPNAIHRLRNRLEWLRYRG